MVGAADTIPVAVRCARCRRLAGWKQRRMLTMFGRRQGAARFLVERALRCAGAVHLQASRRSGPPNTLQLQTPSMSTGTVRLGKLSTSASDGRASELLSGRSSVARHALLHHASGHHPSGSRPPLTSCRTCTAAMRRGPGSTCTVLCLRAEESVQVHTANLLTVYSACLCSLPSALAQAS